MSEIDDAWISYAAESIVRDWPAWLQEARNHEDGEDSRHLVRCIIGRLRWLRANHSVTRRKNPLCPYPNHHESCDCQGMGGDR